MSDQKHSRVAQRARQIWQREGCPQGRADAHWKQAQEELAREAGQTGSRRQSAPYVPADEAMIEPAADSPVIAGVSVPSEPPPAGSRSGTAQISLGSHLRGIGSLCTRG